MPASPTILVQRAAAGDSEAMRSLFSTLYPDIKRLARSRLAQAGGITGLNATALVHEGFMRMAEREGLQGQTRLQFFADATPAPWMDVTDMVALDQALNHLQKLDLRLYQVIELHVFSGMSLQEVADELSVTLRTVNRDLLKARALLANALGTPEPEPEPEPDPAN